MMRSLASSVVIAIALLLSAAPVSAQNKAHKVTSTHKVSRKHSPAHKPREAAPTAVSSAHPGEAKVAAAPVAKPGEVAPPPPAAGSDDDVKKEGGKDVKVVEFTGLDIEGQLKTPQMLYFLNRLRAEFGRPRLPHRSFMPELQRGTQEKAF